MYTMQDATTPVIARLTEVRELINNLLILLSPKEKHIIENRYSLNDRPHATLEKIGREFGVTRERIRQIEKNALKKLARNVVNTPLHNINLIGNEVIKKYDGVLLEDKIFSEILAMSSDPNAVSISALRLSLELDANLERIPNTIHFYPYFKVKTVDGRLISQVCEETAVFLAVKKEVQPLDFAVGFVEKKIGKRISRQLLHSCAELSRKLKLVKKGVGLSTWRHINPRTLRDKILFILNEIRKPMHYVEISNRIAEAKFDRKVINVQAVHNELIRDELFVLIGRGIYALRTWGYEDGTVSDVIAGILKLTGPLERDKIIEEVLKKRHVKRITIVLNLKNKPIFDRVGRSVYALKNN